MTQLLAHIWQDNSGQDMAEYAIMLGVIAAVTIGAITLLGQGIQGMFTKITTLITTP
ncbi:MAG: Flp family type IVb pilin [Acidobacteria bacterium]|nr:MAG: Flp family type IVb pilin [Acidobacteriota bacterium]